MNKYIILCLCLVFIVLSCKKKSPEPNVNDLEGRWELRHVAGVQIQGAIGDYIPGNGNVLVFNGQTFKQYIASKLVDSGTYSLQKANMMVNTNQANYSISFNNAQKYVNFSGSQLIVFDGTIAADGTESTYKKMDVLSY